MKQVPKAEIPSQKRILFIITKSNFGGAQRYVFDLVTNLPRDRFSVAVVVGAPAGIRGELAEKLTNADAPMYALASLGRDIAPWRDMRSFFEIRSVIKAFKPDVVHLNSSKAAFLGALAARTMAVPSIITTIHGWPYLEKRNILWRFVIAFASWIVALASSKVICVSSTDKRAARWMPFVGRRFVVVHNGIAPFSVLAREQAREGLFPAEETATHSNDLWVTTMAELNPNKNHLTALKTVEEYNSVHSRKIFYCIFGDGETRAAIEEYIAAHALSEQVRLLGNVTDSRKFMGAFDAFLWPSRKEGLPYALLEAASAGLPVIASRVGGIPEIIEHERSGILIGDAEDHVAFADALDRIAEDSSMRELFVRDMRNRIRTLFSLKAMLEETMRLY